jgi:preprotein translocase subunit Sec61beta
VVGFLLATSRFSDGWTVYGVLIDGTAVLRIASVLVSVVVLVANLLRVQGTLKF